MSYVQSAFVEPLIQHFYPDDTPLRQLLWSHSVQVRDKALAILANPVASRLDINVQRVVDGAMLHDIGIGRCRAPDIYCTGIDAYIAHGICGAAMLRAYGREIGWDLEVYARICERHTGVGITAQTVRKHKLPLPERDFVPETLEEKLVCLADKFYSKSGDRQEKRLATVRRSLMKFGDERRFDALCFLFGVE